MPLEDLGHLSNADVGDRALGEYVERDAAILGLCAGKSVLHLGCIGFTDSAIEEKVALAPLSLHAALSRVSKCVGVDIDGDTLEQLQERGVFQNAIVGDVEELDRLAAGLGQFDVVVAGDIIEHLSNPGRMLDSGKRFITPDTLFVVSTPSAFGLPAYLRMLSGRYAEGKQHVISFNPTTLRQLLERHGYAVVRARACYQAQDKTQLLFRVLSKPLEWFPKLGGTLLFECRLANPVSPVWDSEQSNSSTFFEASPPNAAHTANLNNAA